MGCCSSTIAADTELTLDASEFIDMSLTSIQLPELTSEDITPRLLESSFISFPVRQLTLVGPMEFTGRKYSAFMPNEDSLETNASVF
jgi:hypothetical protein